MITKTGPVFEASTHIAQASKEAIKRAGTKGVDIIRQATPVRTGRLSEGFYATANSIENEVPYTVFVEEGTRYTEPRWMVRRNLKRIEAELADGLGHSVTKRLS